MTARLAQSRHKLHPWVKPVHNALSRIILSYRYVSYHLFVSIICKGRDDILDQIAYLHRESDITVILVSHSMEDVAKYADRLIVMNKGEFKFQIRIAMKG